MAMGRLFANAGCLFPKSRWLWVVVSSLTTSPTTLSFKFLLSFLTPPPRQRGPLMSGAVPPSKPLKNGSSPFKSVVRRLFPLQNRSKTALPPSNLSCDGSSPFKTAEKRLFPLQICRATALSPSNLSCGGGGKSIAKHVGC